MKVEIDEEIFELAKENDLNPEQAQSLQELADDWGLDADEAYELWDLTENS